MATTNERARRAHHRATVVHGLVATFLFAAAALLGAGAVPVSAAVRHRSGGTRGIALEPKDFAPGACVAFSPTKGNRHLTVFLDAGHGGIDPGATGTTATGQTIEEADETLPVELDAMALLRAQGFRVVVSRTRATTVVRLGPGDTDEGVLSLQGSHDDVAARAICANDAKAAALVGIYFDAGGSPQNAGSLTAFDASRPFAAANLRLATLVQTDVLNDMNANGWQIPNDGVESDSTLGSFVGNPDDGGIADAAASYNHLLLLGPAQAGYFSTPSLMPGALIEPLYVTDPFEASIADSAPGQDAIAHGIASAVEQFLAPPPVKPHGRTVVHVRTGK